MKIVAIAPYHGLKQVIRSVGNKMEGIELEVETGDLEEGVDIAKKAVSNGADIIISRGGTAELIKQEVKIPLIEIEVSAYDLLRIFTLIKDNTEKKAIVGFNSVIESAKTICDLLEIEVSAFTISEEGDVVPRLIELQKKNYNIIIGDTITVRKAESLGMNGLLLTSGKESIEKAFEEAVKVKTLYAPLLNKALIPQEIVEQSEKAVFVFDENKSPIYMNGIGKPLYEDLNNSEFKNWINQIYDKGSLQSTTEFNEQIWNINGFRLNYMKESYACIELTISNLQKEGRVQGVNVITPLYDGSVQSMNWFSTKNSIMRETIEKAKAYSVQNENVWVSGEVGTGKESLAYLIHLGSSRSNHPLTIIDCELVRESDWAHLIKEDPGFEGIIHSNRDGAIYIKKIEKLSIPGQKMLLNYLIQSKDIPRIITSSRVNIDLQVDKGLFLYELYLKLSPLQLTLPPLRERPEDLGGLTQLFINKYNYDYGKEIAGIRSEALEVLKKQPWAGNVDELMKVIKETILMAEGPFIEIEEIEKVLVNYQPKNELESSVSLSGTLKDIELEIIRKVFMEENMNHSKTAKRLGINRSTLWRKLKDD